MNILLTVIIAFFVTPLYGQTLTEIQKGWQTQYILDEQPIPTAELWPLLESQSATRVLALQTKRELRTARYTQAASVLVLGIQTAQWISGQKPPQWQYTAPAVVALGVNIPLERKGRKKLRRAIQGFNQVTARNEKN